MQLDALLRRWEREKGNFPHAARKQAELALQKLNAEPQAAVKAKTNPSAIFNSFTEYLQKIAFYSGVAALGAYVVKNKLRQLWGYDLSTVVGLLITILSFLAASFTTFFFISERLPRVSEKKSILWVYLFGAPFIAVSMFIFNVSALSIKQQLLGTPPANQSAEDPLVWKSPRTLVTVTDGKGEQKIEILIVEDQKLNETSLTIKPKKPDDTRKMETKDDGKTVD